ncbi:MAG: NAD+ synthase [Ignavibacterium sp.]|nr:NAD+ synthase [Ignavibacterium sp.]
MKIALAQHNYIIGDFSGNKSRIIESINLAIEQGADVVVFSELAVCGYPPADLLEFDSFIINCKEAIENIASHCIGIAAIVGAPSFNPKLKGKRLFNSAYVLKDGKIDSLYHKGLLPDYDVFDEYRYFEPATEFNIIELNGVKIALTVCEDLWNMNQSPMYSNSPMEQLSKQNPDIIINISASPFSYDHAIERKTTMCANALHYNIPLINVNQVGAHTELLFDGGSLVINSRGGVVAELSFFNEDFRVFDMDEVDNLPEYSFSKTQSKEEKCALIYNALIMGIKDYFRKLGFQKAILGLSGGLDSALVLALAVEALGNDNVWAVLMPGPYSSEHSVDDAICIANNLNVKYDIIPINDTYNILIKTLAPNFNGTSFGIAEENLQARARAIILMGLSNKFGNVLLNTSNKSEAAVGYGTLYGDMCGGLSVIGDVYKTEVYELAEFINGEKEIIPRNTILKPPSAELRPNQKDSDSLPEYDVLDQILRHYIEDRMSKDEIVSLGFDKDVVSKAVHLVNINEYKRYQTAPVLRISGKAFGIGRRMPIVARYSFYQKKLNCLY